MAVRSYQVSCMRISCRIPSFLCTQGPVEVWGYLGSVNPSLSREVSSANAPLQSPRCLASLHLKVGSNESLVHVLGLVDADEKSLGHLLNNIQ